MSSTANELLEANNIKKERKFFLISFSLINY